MQIKGIIFDKDGTLIDFQSLWLRAANEVANLFLQINGLDNDYILQQDIMTAMGVDGNEITTESPLAYQTYPDIADGICLALNKRGIHLERELTAQQLSVLFESVISRDDFSYQEIVPIKPLIQELHDMQLKVALATADTNTAVKRCFRQLGILDDFDFLGWDDGMMKPKPDTDMFVKFQKMFGLQAEEILVVGDTMNDMYFAHRCHAKAVGVLSGLAKKEELEKEADILLKNVGKLPVWLKEYMGR